MIKVIKFVFIFLILVLAFSSRSAVVPVYAGSSATDLITAVNEYRAGYGLAPYNIDGGMMGIAQAHSDYQASINQLTHNRADGGGPQDEGISSENIAMMTRGDVSPIIHSSWQDYWHFHTMVGYTSGLVGAGEAESNGVVYYTLDVKNTGDFTRLADQVFGFGQAPSTGSVQATQPPAIQPVLTAAPREDGAVIHLVENGQSLWAIMEAYGVNIPTLAALNGLDPAKPVIWVGQEIIVQPPLPATQTPTITLTPIPPTATSRPTRTPNLTVESSATPISSPTPTSRPPLVDLSDPNPAAVAIIVICALGLAGIIISMIWSKKG